MRWTTCVILVALAACDGEDNFCDPQQHYLTWNAADTSWIEYVDADTYIVGPHAVAVGGTARYVVSSEDGCGSAFAPGPLLVSGASQIATLTVDGATIDIHAVATGGDTLTITNEIDTTTRPVEVAAIDSVRLVSDEMGVPGAFFEGIPQAKVQLMSGDQWVVDRTLTVGGPFRQGAAWNLLDFSGIGPGTYAENVFAGGSTWPVTVTVVDHIDDVVAGTPTMNVPVWTARDVCFFAHTGGAVVAGVPWTFDYDPDGGRVAHPNCVEVWASRKDEKSTTVTAHALGMSATATVTFTR